MTLNNTILSALLLLTTLGWSQTIMFDDFNYTGVSDPQLPAFNKWSVVSGTNGPPTNAQYKSENIKFIDDSLNPGNKLITLSTTVNGTTKATTHSRIETSGYDYFEGTYAARVYFSDVPKTYGDANIQTFYTIVSWLLGQDSSKYSEIDFEYMASDAWSTSNGNQVMYMTAWNRYIASPWQAWNAHKIKVASYEGWHTVVCSATDGVNVKFWIDGTYMGSVSKSSKDGSSVYPRSNMQVACANWIWNNKLGSSTDDRTTTMKVDWVLHYKDEEKSPTQVDSIVNSFRNKGVVRRNLSGAEHPLSTKSQGSIKTSIKVYPNPSKNGEFNLSNPIKNGRVYNSLGKLVVTLNNESVIDLKSYPSGLYYLNTNGGSLKLIKNK